MDDRLRKRWDRASRMYDLVTHGDEKRLGPYKRRLFARMKGRCLLIGTGTGNDFKYFPPGLRITAIDVSPAMLERARRKASAYAGQLSLKEMDVRALDYDNAAFDTVVTSCVFCSVPDPGSGLRQLHRCLRPEGRLLMFEHVRSRLGPIAFMQDLLTPFTSRFGPDFNRDTVTNVLRAGFVVVREDNVFLDVVKTIVATPE